MSFVSIIRFCLLADIPSLLLCFFIVGICFVSFVSLFVSACRCTCSQFIPVLVMTSDVDLLSSDSGPVLSPEQEHLRLLAERDALKVQVETLSSVVGTIRSFAPSLVAFAEEEKEGDSSGKLFIGSAAFVDFAVEEGKRNLSVEKHASCLFDLSEVGEAVNGDLFWADKLFRPFAGLVGLALSLVVLTPYASWYVLAQSKGLFAGVFPAYSDIKDLIFDVDKCLGYSSVVAFITAIHMCRVRDSLDEHSSIRYALLALVCSLILRLFNSQISTSVQRWVNYQFQACKFLYLIRLVFFSREWCRLPKDVLFLA